MTKLDIKALFKEQTQWSWLLERAEEIDFNSVEFKKRYIKSIKFLSEELGKGFLRQMPSNSNPMIHRLVNRAPWQMEELVHYAETLRIQKLRDPNYKILLDKLVSHKRLRTEGEPFMDIIRDFTDVGAEVYLIPEGNTKTPDLRVHIPESKEDFYIEVGNLEESQLNKKISSQFYYLEELLRYETFVFILVILKKSFRHLWLRMLWTH